MIIYKITNKINDKSYIGQTINNLDERKRGHLHPSKNSSQMIIVQAIKKYGEENFSFEEIDKADTIEELDKKERYWIAFYDTLIQNGKGYNVLEGGGNSRRIVESTTVKEVLRFLPGNRPIYCHQTQEIFFSIQRAERKFKVAYIVIDDHLKGERISIPSGHTFEEVTDPGIYPLPKHELCYEGMEKHDRPVYCFQNQKLYANHIEAENDLGFKKDEIYDFLTNGVHKHVKRYSFEFKKSGKVYPVEKQPLGIDRSIKPVRCIETGIVYSSAFVAAKELNLRANKICEVCSGKRRAHGSLHFEFAFAS